MKKVSFDFDSTLDREDVQQIAKQLAKAGVEIWIVTTRVNERLGQPNWNNDVLEVALRTGISLTNIHFTNGTDKWKFLGANDFDWHLDDDDIEIELMHEYGIDTRGILRNDHSDWATQCLEIIND